MSILGVDSKCYILALFIRSDGERFLLGSGYYEFKDKQQHFAANTIANDVIEVQGNDGYLLGGQVRRPGVQSFDGYVGDGTTSKTEVEEYRRDFLSFFRKNFTYKVVYVFPDGSAIQRKRGFLVDAPVVQELYQIYPEYHVALNFEDINYYFYDEDADGDEIYGKSAVIGLATAASGGLIWDDLGAVSLPYSWANPVEFSGSEIAITNNLDVRSPITDLQLQGDTFQQTYSGKNLLKPYQNPSNPVSAHGLTATLHSNGTIAVNGTATSNTWIEFIYKYGSGTEAQTNPTIVLSSSNTYTMSLTKEGVATGDITLFIQYDASGSQKNISVDDSTPFSESDGVYRGYLRFSTGASCTNAIFCPMIEAGSTATSFEPYVGGIPSPNPDYPQDVQVVTGEQTVKVHGKNLLDYLGANYADQGANAVKSPSDVSITKTSDGQYKYAMMKLSLAESQSLYGKDITLSYKKVSSESGVSSGVRVYWVTENNFSTGAQLLNTISTTDGEKNGSFNIPSAPPDSTKPIIALLFYPDTTNTNVADSSVMTISNLQLEEGSTATAYQPYQSQSYTVNLGSIELCKIGDYQDSIYKSGNDWYVRKEVGKVALGDLVWDATSTNQTGVYRMTTTSLSGLFVPPASNGVAMVGFCSHFGVIRADGQGTWGCHLGISGNANGAGNGIYTDNYNTSTSAADFKTWLQNNNVMFYYALATPTDTQITDAGLIGELEALGAMKLFVGENNLSVSATDVNLSAILKANYFTDIDYSGAGYEWEPGGAGGIKIITVDSIDNVYPLLTVTGPAINPTVTNITTGTIFSYNGTVTASQTLRVDMMNKTATLNGTSVIGNVSGDWLYFQPGDNRVDYSTGNTDTPDALIEWQEIVG